MNYIEGSGTHTFYNVSRVFCGWDYNITDKAAARLKHKSFYNEMKVRSTPYPNTLKVLL